MMATSAEMNSFMEFNELCKSQGVVLHPSVNTAGIYGLSEGDSLDLQGFYAAIAAVGEVLDSEPRSKLASRNIREHGYSDASDATSQAKGVLIDIINASIDHGSTRSHDYAFTSKSQPSIVGVCSEAEINFARTIAQMQQPDKPLDATQKYPWGYQIITGTEGEPIAIRKGVSEPSTLTLVDVSINGIPYPAGSIMQAELRHDSHADFSSDFTERMYGRSTTVPHGEHTHVDSSYVSRIRLRRLSAFVLRADQRVKEFAECFEDNQLADADTASVDVLRTASLDEITDIARAALQSADTLPPPYQDKSGIRFPRFKSLLGRA